MKIAAGFVSFLVLTGVPSQAHAQGTHQGATVQFTSAFSKCVAAGAQVDALDTARPSCAAEPGSASAIAVRSNSEEALPEAPRPKAVSNTYNPYAMPFHLEERERSWGRAMRNPVVLTTSALIAGLTAVQIMKTDRCIDSNKPACNLVTGKSRTANYAVNLPLTAGFIWAAGKLKQEGKSTGLVLALMGSLTYEGTLAYTANPHVLVCQAGRTPQCQ